VLIGFDLIMNRLDIVTVCGCWKLFRFVLCQGFDLGLYDWCGVVFGFDMGLCE